MKKALASSGLLLAVLAGSPASAATNAARNRCSDAVRVLRSNPSMWDLSQEIDPLSVRNGSRHFEQVADGWRRAQAQLAQIPAGELDENDPDLQDCVEEVKKWRAYVEALKPRLEEAAQRADVWVPFLEEVKGYRDAMVPLVGALFGDADVFSNRKPADVGRVLDAMSKVAESCAARLPDAGKSVPVLDSGQPAGSVYRTAGVAIPSSFFNRPDHWCYVARERQALAVKAVSQVRFHAEGYGNFYLAIPETLKSLGEGRTDMEAWLAVIVVDSSDFEAALRKDAEAWYRAVGVSLPENPFPNLRRVLDTLRSKVDEVAPTLHFERKGPHDAASEAAARKALKGIFGDAKVVAQVMDAADFTIDKYPTGIPRERYRSGQILYKRPKAKWCEQRTFTYAEPYAGGGRYAKGETKILAATRFVACD